MASILDTYNGSEFSKIGKSNKDKTPISADEKSKLNFTDSKLDTARGGKVLLKPYSDTVNKK
jgi:hypothetical protein